MKNEKISDLNNFESNPEVVTFLDDYKNIQSICDQGAKVPPISIEKAKQILEKVKPHVNDLYSITALHYINGGPEALERFCFLLNTFLENV